MMKAVTSVFVLLTILASNTIYGSANIATFPITVRHTYADGTYTEIDCRTLKIQDNSSSCALIISAGDKKKSFPLALSKFGYRSQAALEGHYYWPRDGVDDFMVRFPVFCNEQDIALAPGADPDRLECLLNVEPTSDSELTSYTEITGTNRDGTNVDQIRGAPRDDT